MLVVSIAASGLIMPSKKTSTITFKRVVTVFMDLTEPREQLSEQDMAAVC